MSYQSNQPNPGSEQETSDLFSIRKYSAGASIPLIEHVPETKEEIQRRRLMRATYVVIAIIVVAITSWTILYITHENAVTEAFLAASDDGRVSSAQEALTLTAGDDDPVSTAMSLRLRAMLVLNGAAADADEITAALEPLPGDDYDVSRERGVAQTYLALARGDLAAAMTTASAIVATHGDHKAEGLRARALAAWAVGNIEIAALAAQHAAAERPEAPRHAALHAELLGRSGDYEGAIAVLDALPEDRRTAQTRMARARLMDGHGESLDAVASHAQTVLEDSAATNHEKAWARLLLARAAAATGDRVTARQHLDQAVEVAPPGDETFTLMLTEVALRMAANHFAAAQAERLPSPLSIDAGRRAQLSAELALARRDLRRAASALEHAPAGARTSLARARLLEARGEFDQARPLYLEAAAEPARRVTALVYLAAMELSQGDAEAAASRIEPLLSEYPRHPDIVPVAVEAQLGLDHADRAMELVTPALEDHPDDVRLLGARAHVEAALEHWEDALATLDSALRIESDDPDLHADRGQAAHRLSRFEVARQAFDAALELSESHPLALTGRLELDVAERRVPEAQRILERIDEAEIRSIQVARLRARLRVLELAGNSGTRAVRIALARYPHDEVLVEQLAWLYLQAEQSALALRRFSQLLDGEDDRPEILLAKVLAQLRMRAANPARSGLEAFAEGRDVDSLPDPVRAQWHALQGRLEWAGQNRAAALRQIRAAQALDSENGEAHLLLGEIARDREEDGTEELEASLAVPHPSSRALALLSIREEEPDARTCDYARRYRRAAPNGQYSRGIWRVLRDCRRLEIAPGQAAEPDASSAE